MERKILIIILFILFTSVFFLAACDKVILVDEVSSCIENKIKDIKNEAVRNPPAQVWKWEVDGQIYFYFTSDCCDQFNYLFDKDCNIVCAPDGGIAGIGDGNCPDFNGAIEKTLVWKDFRN